jgi:hypothetical protein
VTTPQYCRFLWWYWLLAYGLMRVSIITKSRQTGQQPVGLAQLADDLLWGVAASLHRVLLPVGAVGLTYQVDQSQGVGSERLVKW